MLIPSPLLIPPENGSRQFTHSGSPNSTQCFSHFRHGPRGWTLLASNRHPFPELLFPPSGQSFDFFLKRCVGHHFHPRSLDTAPPSACCLADAFL